MPTPADVLDLSVWKLTLPTGSPGEPTEIPQKELATYPGGLWCAANAAGTGVSFAAPVNGFTTSGSKYPRSELREMTKAGKNAAWAGKTGWHVLSVVESFDALPNDKPHLVGAQIHDAKKDWCVFRLEGKQLWMTSSDNTHYKLADSGYVLGTPFLAQFVVYGGKISAFYNGRLIGTLDAKKLKAAYFKSGAYVQANCTNSKPCASSNLGQTTIYHVSVIHADKPGTVPTPALPGVPAPPPVDPTPDPVPDPTPTPVPVPTPTAQVIIQITRHGEKPSSADDHTLSAKGRQRAAALPPIFTTPRADLFRPTWIFASKGDTTSMRMLQTAQPTAAALGLPIDTSLDSENAVTATAKLLAKQARAGKVVWAVLEHSCIAAVASALVKELGGTWNAKPPSGWSDSDFSSVYKFVGDGKGNWTFSKTDEGVLPGDPGYPA